MTTQEKGVRGITSINSRTEAQMSHITLLNINDENKVKVLKPFLVNISCFSKLTTSPAKLSTFIHKHLMEPIKKRLLPKIDPLNGSNKLQVIIGLPNVSMLANKVENSFLREHFPSLIVMKSQFSSEHFLAGYITTTDIQTEKPFSSFSSKVHFVKILLS